MKMKEQITRDLQNPTFLNYCYFFRITCATKLIGTSWLLSSKFLFVLSEHIPQTILLPR